MSGLAERAALSTLSPKPREVMEVATNSLATTGELSSLGCNRNLAATFMCTSPPKVSTLLTGPSAIACNKRRRACG